jgi:hypothetical protein
MSRFTSFGGGTLGVVNMRGWNHGPFGPKIYGERRGGRSGRQSELAGQAVEGGAVASA